MVWELSTNGTFFTTDEESIEFGTNKVFLPRWSIPFEFPISHILSWFSPFSVGDVEGIFDTPFFNQSNAGVNGGNFETPFFNTFADADAGLDPSGVVQGHFYPRGGATPGDWGLGFFEDDAVVSWVVGRLGFGDVDTPNVITGTFKSEISS
jgi:hypothetical protein